jgi:aprataxin
MHVHFVTADFASSCLKNKKHWNSFNGPFFLELDACIAALERGERADVPASQLPTLEPLLKAGMTCAACSPFNNGKPVALADMRAVKYHVASANHLQAASLSRGNATAA